MRGQRERHASVLAVDRRCTSPPRRSGWRVTRRARHLGDLLRGRKHMPCLIDLNYFRNGPGTNNISTFKQDRDIAPTLQQFQRV
jgi:hypothetical protein